MTLDDVDALRLETLNTREGDVFVLTVPGHIDSAVAARLREDWARFCPGAKCVVMGDGLKLRVIRSMVAGDLGLPP